MQLAGAFLAGREAIAAERRYPLKVHVCRTCALVQILDPIDPDVLFRDYAFSSSTVGSLVQRLQPSTIVEFGCNDGILLVPLRARGVTAVGVDISENITAMAREKGL